VDDSIRQVQIQKLQQLKHDRNHAKIDQCLQLLNDKAASGENLMPVVIDAVENKVTLGEISDELRSVFGEHK
jgi:methylmalonyl-CoA mutase N-terminal domain/subunit